MDALAARLESPALPRDKASLIASSCFGDLLVLTEGCLKYAHSNALHELCPVSINPPIFVDAITKLDFNESADTVLFVGHSVLGAVMRVPRVLMYQINKNVRYYPHHAVNMAF